MATVSDNRVVMSVADVKACLAENIKEAKKHDADRLKEHRAAERYWLTQFRDELRRLAKLSYADISPLCDSYGAVKVKSADRKPNCPTAAAPSLERWAERFKNDSRDVIHIEPGSALDQAITWRPDGYSTDMC
jgi:hypothetical protein